MGNLVRHNIKEERQAIDPDSVKECVLQKLLVGGYGQFSRTDLDDLLPRNTHEAIREILELGSVTLVAEDRQNPELMMEPQHQFKTPGPIIYQPTMASIMSSPRASALERGRRVERPSRSASGPSKVGGRGRQERRTPPNKQSGLDQPGSQAVRPESSSHSSVRAKEPRPSQQIKVLSGPSERSQSSAHRSREPGASSGKKTSK